MKFKLFASLSLPVLLVGVTACSSSSESRTRNAALAPCSGSPVNEASKNLVNVRLTELKEIEQAWRRSEVAVSNAQTALENARAAGTGELTDAVKRFDASEVSVAELTKTLLGIRDKERSSEYVNQIMKLLGTAMAEYSLAQMRMNALLERKAQAINEALGTYNSTVRDRDNAHAVYLSAVVAFNRVVAITMMPNCPVLSAGDAEAYVKDVGATSTPTTTPRRQFQFIDSPAVTDPPGDITESSVAATSTTTSTSTTTTSVAPANPGVDATMSTLPLPELPASVEYIAPTIDQILADISERVSSVMTDSRSDEQKNEDVKEIRTIIDDLASKINSGEISVTNNQLDVLFRQTTALIAVFTKSLTQYKNTSSEDSSSGGIRKFSVLVSAAGFTPGSDVVFATRSGRTLRQSIANKEGIVLFDADVDASADNEVLIMGGRNSAGNVVAVPVLVEFDENVPVSTSTVPNEDSTTDTTVVDTGESTEANDSSGSPWVLWLLVLVAVLVLGYGIQKLVSRRGSETK
jgi:hypothetical protein